MPGHPPHVIVALDVASGDRARALATHLDPAQCRVKVGNELFTAAGPGLVEWLQARGFAVFLDLKYHDIPNTVAAACRAAASLGVWMVNCHALGGERMMAAAREGLEGAAQRPLLTAVTALTSHDEGELAQLGLDEPHDTLVGRWAGMAMAAGLDGVVCSARALEAGADYLVIGRPITAAAEPQRALAAIIEGLRSR